MNPQKQLTFGNVYSKVELQLDLEWFYKVNQDKKIN